MAGLPHYTQIRAANKKEEPVYMNLFDVTFQLPPSISNGDVLTQACSKISLPTNPTVETVQQQYKFVKRSYLTFPTDTGGETEMTFLVNLDESNSPYVYKMLDQLYKIAYNQETGETGLKVDYAFEMIVDVHNKRGDLIRRVILKDCMMKDINSWEMSWDTGESIFEATVNIRFDDWDDLLN